MQPKPRPCHVPNCGRDIEDDDIEDEEDYEEEEEEDDEKEVRYTAKTTAARDSTTIPGAAGARAKAPTSAPPAPARGSTSPAGATATTTPSGSAASGPWRETTAAAKDTIRPAPCARIIGLPGPGRETAMNRMSAGTATSRFRG
ncbi:hypothetical protein PG996_010919 [Apiospora saccharicola]|uniref:Uncharacterized protein n=1 Tax=Apiospora saccharicola TaxID=335842 RepID=A0ABR1UPZ2_9PEZI